MNCIAGPWLIPQSWYSMDGDPSRFESNKGEIINWHTSLDSNLGRLVQSRMHYSLSHQFITYLIDSLNRGLIHSHIHVCEWNGEVSVPIYYGLIPFLYLVKGVVIPE